MRSRRLSDLATRLVACAGAALLASPGAARACPKCKAGPLAELESLRALPPVRQAEETRPESPAAAANGERACACCEAGRAGADAGPAAGDTAPGGAAAVSLSSRDAAAALPDRPADSRFTFAGGIDLTTGYYHRGLNMGDRGVILQPHLTVGLPTVRAGDWVVSPYVGTWNSFQEGMKGHGEVRPPPADNPNVTIIPNARGPFPRHYTGDPDHDNAYGELLDRFFGGADTGGSAYSDWGWYESELMAGVLLAREPLRLDLKYSAHLFPGGDVDSYQEASLKASYDLAAHLPASAGPARPASLVAYAELVHQLAGTDGRHTYLELGAEPLWVFPVHDRLVAVGAPVTVGLSIDDYYADLAGRNQTLGFWAVGLTASVRVAEGTAVGSVYLNASVRYLRLESDLLILANDGDEDAVVGTVGVSFSK